jgi:myo-inositol 2-dehydrogenase / D-chiro-inositol 1-dehydrogenase
MLIGLAGAGRMGSFHAETLKSLPAVSNVIVADADAARAQRLAERLGLLSAASLAELLGAGVDAAVIATPTSIHVDVVLHAIAAGIPVFCEKPLAPDAGGTLQVIKAAEDAGVPVQVGFQRRFDTGYRGARSAAQGGRLGWVHSIRAVTLDPAPPPPAYLAGSGGIFRDCCIHDFDAIRWVSGHEVTQAFAGGANRGADYFREAGDPDTALALLTLDDGTLASVSAGRYNAAGYDARLEVLGSAGSVCAGLDDRMPLRPAQGGSGFPAGPACQGFLDRFRGAFREEMAVFVSVAAGKAEVPCTMHDSLEAMYIAAACELSRTRREPVEIAEVRGLLSPAGAEAAGPRQG